MVLSQIFVLPRAFSYIPTKLQNDCLCESLINSFEVPKSGKTTIKLINKSLKSIVDIFIGWVRFTASGPFSPHGKSRFEILLVKTFNLKQ